MNLSVGASVQKIDDLLKEYITVPNYQRPYKWSNKNVSELLGDIETAIKDSKRYPLGYKYRVGTVILHKNEINGAYEIVDGQQRLITLTLINYYLSDYLSENRFICSLLSEKFTNRVSQFNLHENYRFIKDWFSLKSDDDKKEFSEVMRNILECVVIVVEKISEAFQLFDSQNTRGKALDPHDLLKAYHLREMKDFPHEMQHAVTKWESVDTQKIKELFDYYLFPILNWARREKTHSFTEKDIDVYKGISEYSYYTYAKRASQSMPYFQITEQTLAGNDFFEMVEHYLVLLEDVKKEIKTRYKEIYLTIEPGKTPKNVGIDVKSVGFNYTKTLFYCACLCYADKFRILEDRAVKKLFVWAFALRLDMDNLGFDSVNKYAIGTDENRYTNKIPMFSKISHARLHTEISDVTVKLPETVKPKWKPLADKIKELLK